MAPTFLESHGSGVGAVKEMALITDLPHELLEATIVPGEMASESC